jgi:hypothetical protein
MEYDEQKIDRAALALLYLAHNPETYRSWRSIDWGVTDRLFEAGLILDPKNKNKSIQFTEEGLLLAKQAFVKDFDGKI